MEIRTSRTPQRLTKQQFDSMKASGLDDQQIRSIASERNIKLPSGNVEGDNANWFGRAVGGTARFIGVEKLGQGLAYSLFRLTPEYKGLVSDLEKGLISPDEFESLTTGDITSGEVLGSAARTVGTVLSAGQWGKVAPAMTKGISAVGNVKKGIKIGAGIGAGLGGIRGTAQGISRGEDIVGIGGSAIRGSIGGGVVGAGVGALGGAVSGGAFLQGAKQGAIAGAKGGAISGTASGLGTALEEEQDISGLTAEVAGGAIRGGAKGAIFGGLVGGVTSSIGQGINNKIARKAELAEAIRQETTQLQEMTGRVSPRTAPYTVDQGKIVKDKIFNQTVRDASIPPRELSIIKGSQPDDLSAYKRMIDISKIDDPTTVRRPVEVAGETFVKRIKDIMGVKRKAGEEIGKLAQENLNRPISGVTEAVNSLSDDLSAKGITIGKGGRIDFKGSLFDDMPEVQRTIQSIYRRSQAVGDNGKAAHELKRYIYERINYAQRGEGLTGEAESVLKSFARNIDFALDSADDAYRITNQRFSTAINAQTEVQRLLGRDFNVADDFANLRGGEVINRVLGNASARPLQLLSDVESATRKLGFKYKDNVIAQIKFADILDDIVGPPTRSLGGQMERATSRALNIRDLSSEVMDKGGEFLKKALQRTPTERLDALTRYINILSK